MSGVTLYGSKMSYFTGKVRAYFRWKEIEFTEIAPTPEIMKSVIIKHIGWPVVPVVRMPDGEFIQDTADIITYFERLNTAQPVMPPTPLQRLATYLLQLFADEWLVLPAMHYRWNKNEDWIYGEFGKSAAPNGSPEEQYEAGKRVGQKFKGFVPQLGITEDTAAGIETAYEQFLADFSTHLETLPFLLGTRASYADFAMIGPLYAHQYLDQESGKHMKRVAPKVADYVERVIAGEGRHGDFVPLDDLPKTLLPILRIALSEQLPVLASTLALYQDWADTVEPQSDVPRGLGAVPFTTGGCSGMTGARTFPLYRLQSALDAYEIMLPSDKKRADAFFRAIDARSFTSLRINPRLTRRNYRLATI